MVLDELKKALDSKIHVHLSLEPPLLHDSGVHFHGESDLW